ncbi:MAG: Mut7-C RNAse domain-containing protein [Nitrososphaeria archaeon]
MPERPRISFITDSMLGNLARKLRLFGFDTLYYRTGDDEGLLHNFQERILLTCDRELFRKSALRNRRVIFIERADDEIEALRKIFSELGIRPEVIAVRCTVCNGPLRRMSRGEVASSDLIPSSTKRRYREFYVCASCGKIYWYGSHWKSINATVDRLREALETKL